MQCYPSFTAEKMVASSEMFRLVKKDIGTLQDALARQEWDRAAEMVLEIIKDIQEYAFPLEIINLLITSFEPLFIHLEVNHALRLHKKCWESLKKVLIPIENSTFFASFITAIVTFGERLFAAHYFQEVKMLHAQMLALVRIKKFVNEEIVLLLAQGRYYTRKPEHEFSEAAYCYVLAETFHTECGDKEQKISPQTILDCRDELIAHIIYARTLAGNDFEEGMYEGPSWLDHHLVWLLGEKKNSELGRLLTLIEWTGDTFYRVYATEEANACYQLLQSIHNRATPALARFLHEGNLNPSEEKVFAEIVRDINERVFIKRKRLKKKKKWDKKFAVAFPFCWWGDKIPLYKMRMQAQEVRKVFLEQGSGTMEYQKAWEHYTLAREELIHGLFQNLLMVFGEPSCGHHFILLGSSGRREACPYSDMECALGFSPHPHDREMGNSAGGERSIEFFRLIFELLNIAIIALGEPPKNPISEARLPEGFRLDEGGNNPLGKEGQFLRHLSPRGEKNTLKTLLTNFQFQKNILVSSDRKKFIRQLESGLIPDIITVCTLLDSYLFVSVGEIQEDSLLKSSLGENKKEDEWGKKAIDTGEYNYFAAMQNILNTPYSDCPILLREALAIILLKGCDAVKKRFIFKKTTDSCDVKKDILELPIFLVKALTIYYGIDLAANSNSTKRAKTLAKQGHIAQPLAKALCSYIEFAKALRLCAHLHYKNETDILYLNKYTVPRNGFLIEERHHKILLAFHRYLILPLFEALRQFFLIAEETTITTQNNSFLKGGNYQELFLIMSEAEKIPTIKNGLSAERIADYLLSMPDEYGHRVITNFYYKAWDDLIFHELTTSNIEMNPLSLVESQHEKSVAQKEAAVRVSWADKCGIVYKRWLQPYIAQQLVDDKGSFNLSSPQRMKDGRRVVLAITNNTGAVIAYAKCYPELPGVQLMVDDLSWRLSGYGNIATLCQFEIAGTNLRYPVLISKPGGQTLQDDERAGNDLSEFEHQLDAEAFCNKVLTNHLIYYDDEKKDNLARQSFEDCEGKLKYRLISIDSDHVFGEEFETNGLINVKTVIYCSNRMYDKLHPYVRIQWQKLNIYLLLKNAMEVWKQWELAFISMTEASPAEQASVFQLNDIELWEKDKIGWWSTNNNFSFVRLALQFGSMANLYQRFQRLKIILENEAAASITLMAIFKSFSPRLAACYEEINRIYPLVFARFDALPKNCKAEEEKTTKLSNEALSSSSDSIIIYQSSQSGLQRIQRTITLAKCRNIEEAISKGSFITPNSGLENELKQVHYYYTNIQIYIKQLKSNTIREFQQLQHADFIKEQVIRRFKWHMIVPPRGETLESCQRDILRVIQGVNFYYLNLRNCNALTDDLLKRVLCLSPDVKELDISNCPRLTNKVFEYISVYCPALEKLYANQLSIDTIAYQNWRGKTFPLIFKSLTHLFLNECVRLQHIETIAPKICFLSLANNVALVIFKVQGNNFHLYLKNWKKITTYEIKYFIQNNSNITEMTLPEGKETIYERILENISKEEQKNSTIAETILPVEEESIYGEFQNVYEEGQRMQTFDEPWVSQAREHFGDLKAPKGISRTAMQHISASINLSEMNLEDDDLKKLCEFISQYSSIRAIDLSRNNITNLHPLIDYLKAHPSVVALDLSVNPIKATMADALANVISLNKDFIALSIPCSLNALSILLKTPLRVLDIRCCTDSGNTRSYPSELADNNHLIYFGASQFFIIPKIEDTISKNKCLEHLNICWSFPSHAYYDFYLEALQNNPDSHLRKLDLGVGGGLVGYKESAPIAKIFAANCSKSLFDADILNKWLTLLFPDYHDEAEHMVGFFGIARRQEIFWLYTRLLLDSSLFGLPELPELDDESEIKSLRESLRNLVCLKQGALEEEFKKIFSSTSEVTIPKVSAVGIFGEQATQKNNQRSEMATAYSQHVRHPFNQTIITSTFKSLSRDEEEKEKEQEMKEERQSPPFWHTISSMSLWAPSQQAQARKLNFSLAARVWLNLGYHMGGKSEVMCVDETTVVITLLDEGLKNIRDALLHELSFHLNEAVSGARCNKHINKDSLTLEFSTPFLAQSVLELLKREGFTFRSPTTTQQEVTEIHLQPRGQGKGK